MEDVLIALLLLVAGVGLALAGLRVFFLLLPVWGFIVGFFFGATLIHSWFGDGYLSTLGGWILGLVIGVVFAFLSYLYWYIGAVFSAGSVGALLATGLLGIFGIDNGWVVFLVAIIAAFIFAVAAFVMALPVYMVAVSTAFAGAFATITGLMLIIDRIDLDNLGYGGAWAAMNDSWLWLLLWALIAGIGIAVQWGMIATVELPTERWVRADTQARQRAAVSSDQESR